MRLLIVSQYFWPESFRINDLAKRLAVKDVEVTVLTGQPNYPEGRVFDGYAAWSCGKESVEGVNVFRVPLAPRGRGRALGLIYNYLSFIVTGTLLGPWLLRRRKIDTIFVYGISPILQAVPAIFLKWWKGAKLIIWVQDLWPESLQATGFVKNRFVLGAVRHLVRWIYHRADAVFVQSRAFIDPVAELCPRDKIQYYPNSAEDAMLSGEEAGACPVPGLTDYFSVVFAGALGTAQALDVILDAAERLKHRNDIRFFLVGSGSRSDWLRESIAARALNNVVLAGRFPIGAMPAIFASASALLVSLTDDPIFAQTIPSKVQSYLASGKPIIGCINGEGARVIEEAEAGLTCPAMDVPGLVRQVERLYEMSPQERASLGRNGRAFFERNFESEKLAADLIVRFERLNEAR